MVTRETLLELALQAIEDQDARIVLADAVQQMSWWDDRCWRLGFGIQQTGVMPHGWEPKRWLESAIMLTPIGPKSIAALLLFGDWSTEMWPVAARCPLRRGAVTITHVDRKRGVITVS